MSETRRDPLHPWPARAMSALLDQGTPPLEAGDPLPLGWHWLYFRRIYRGKELGPDGHKPQPSAISREGLTRRMWAGGELRLVAPLVLGREAEILKINQTTTRKFGRSGPLAFVVDQFSVVQDGRVRLNETRRLVYAKPGGSPAGPSRAPHAPASKVAWRRPFAPSVVDLFRFSALTFNAHRIHYDHPYALREGYPNIVVHGPLMVLALLDAARAHWGAQAECRYRIGAPLLAGEEAALLGKDEGASSSLRSAMVWSPKRGAILEATTLDQTGSA